MLCVITTIRLLLSVDGPNDEGKKFKQVYKVDGPHKGSRPQSTKRTDLTKGQYSSPQSGWTQQRVNTQVHNVDESNKGSILKSTTWTDPTKGQDLNL